jgi:enoyl-CoA hydratase/carnithine racemase
VVLAGAGDKAFVSGADISQFEKQRSGAEAVQQYEVLAEGAQAKLIGFEKPLLAMIRGYCLGGGLNIANNCDLRIAADDARFATPEVDVGLFPYMALAPVSRLIGRRAALELFFTARRIDAAEAVKLGLVNSAVPRAELAAKAQELLDTLCEKSPTALRLGRRAFYATQDLPYPAQLETLCAQLAVNSQCEDAAEGVAAFLEKRKPDFKGR